jgi:glycyl-tRNA synthetase
LHFHPTVAPYTAALIPLSKKLSEPASAVFKNLKSQGFKMQYDDSGSIGKCYRRQDEIGTPVCLTFDFDSLNDQCVTARNRDTTKQERIAIDQLPTYLRDLLQQV